MRIAILKNKARGKIALNRTPQKNPEIAIKVHQLTDTGISIIVMVVTVATKKGFIWEIKKMENRLVQI